MKKIIVLGLASALLLACDANATSNAEDDAGAREQDAGDERGDAGAGDAGAAACVEDPETHVEIINACTDAQAVDKDPKLPLRLADGGLPPLP
jgi:hypothetical protein